MCQVYKVSNKTWIFCTFSCQMKLFHIYHSSCKLVFYCLSFDLDQRWDQKKDQIGMWFLSWDSDLSLLSLEKDLLWLWEKLLHLGIRGEVEDSFSSNYLYGDDPKREVDHNFDFSPMDRSTLTGQPHSILPPMSQTASTSYPASSNSAGAKAGGF